MGTLTTLTDDALITLNNMGDFATGFFVPTVRLGVTGLSRAGKTVFITALIQALLEGGRLPAFRALTDGRLAAVRFLEPPNPTIPRFGFEAHLEALVKDRIWPKSTRQISEIRLELTFESQHFWSRQFGQQRIILDIVDYPGEWLLDLPLLGKSYAVWSAETLQRARSSGHRKIADPWLKLVDDIDPNAPFDEPTAQRLHEAFAGYLQAARAKEHALSALPPGRFLMPGDLEGSPALTFSPLPPAKQVPALSFTQANATLAKIMADRYEAYKDRIIRPFFRDHFARLDRQIVLVDALQAINAGHEAVEDLEAALSDILTCFRPGQGSWLSSILTRRIDRILFAATKADHLHEDDHNDLEALLQALVGRAIQRARYAGAETAVLALAAVRATSQGRTTADGETFPAIKGQPMPGETLDGNILDHTREATIFPGDLPSDPASLFDPKRAPGALNFIRFLPPKIERAQPKGGLCLPHIRLDRALEFLLGDKLQ